MKRTTIFIHGTLPPKPVLSLPMVERFFRCPQGLTKLSELPNSHLKDILTTLSTKHPNEFPSEQLYTFGWSGELNHSGRKKAAEQLFNSIQELTNITLITHSHGGNVALHLDAIAQENQPFTIKELILLACPVQIETMSAINGTTFKEIYSLHSHHDLLQVIDPQGLHSFFENLKTYGLEFTMQNLKQLGPLFSERHFPKDSKVKQLNVRHPLRELLHIEFLLPQFMEGLPSLITKLKAHTKTGNDHDDLTHIFSD